jgi:hypothetical protein
MNSSFYQVARRSFQPLFLLLTVFCVSMANAAIYTFDNLNTGTLAGQDNWRTINANNSSYVVKQFNTGFDQTKIAGNPGTDNGSGSDVHINGRTNDANFTFGNLSGAIGLTLSFDTQVHNIHSGSNEFINFGIADSNDAHGSPGFAYRDSVTSGQSFPGGPTFPAGPSVAFGSSVSSPNAFALPATTTNDWIRLSLVMDFTANGGQGLGSLYYTDLTASGSAQLIASNLALGNPTPNEPFWNTMWSRSDLDTGVVIDNLTVLPTFAAVPEPATWLGGLLAFTSCAAFAQRRRKR